MEITNLAALFFIFGFALCYSSESFTLIIRLTFKAIDKESLGMFYITMVMLGTRLGASLYFPAGAFLVDSGLDYSFILTIFIISTLFTSVVFYLMSAKTVFIVNKIGMKFSTDKISITPYKSSKLKLVYSLPIFFNGLAVVVPLCIATFFPDYRATIIQMGFVVNSIGTIMNVFIIEKYIAQSLQNSVEFGSTAIKEILKARAIGLLLVVLVIGLLSFIITI
jgi:hypothetical protein